MHAGLTYKSFQEKRSSVTIIKISCSCILLLLRNLCLNLHILLLLQFKDCITRILAFVCWNRIKSPIPAVIHYIYLSPPFLYYKIPQQRAGYRLVYQVVAPRRSILWLLRYITPTSFKLLELGAILTWINEGHLSLSPPFVPIRLPALPVMTVMSSLCTNRITYLSVHLWHMWHVIDVSSLTISN